MFRKLTVALLPAVLLVVSFGSPARANVASDEAALLTFLNAVRGTLGVGALRPDPRLADVARNWSARMASAGAISHNPDLASQVPPGWRAIAENVGAGASVTSVANALIASVSHYTNIVNPRYTSVGVGVVPAGGRQWVTQVFSDAPPVAAAPPGTSWYRLVGAGGEVYSFGGAAALPAVAVPGTAVAMASTPSGRGYWTATSPGAVLAVGDAAFFGSMAAVTLSQPVVGMAATPTGRGYWLVARDGGIFSFGDARFFGSTGAIRLNQPIVGMTSSPSGKGYWFVAADGGIFAFGDAGFYGSTGAIKLNQPVVGMESTPSGRGYWLVARDGGIFSFGDARFLGSTGAIRLNQPIVGMSATTSGQGYRFVAADGGIFSFGDAAFFGSAGDRSIPRPITGIVSGG